MTSAVREAQSDFTYDRPSEVVALARAGLLYRKMNATEFWALMDQGFVGEGSFDHIELLGAEIVVKPMGRGNKREKYKSAVLRWMARAVPDELEVGVEPTINFSDEDVLEPDFILYQRSADTTTLDCHLITLLIEVADSSIGIDTREKARRYALHGIAHYWVVDVTRNAIHVFTDPTPTGYASRRLVEGDQSIDPPFANAPAFRLTDLGLTTPRAF